MKPKHHLKTNEQFGPIFARAAVRGLMPAAFGACLLLSGCLLPQPDTPIVPPGAPMAGRAAPAAAERTGAAPETADGTSAAKTADMTSATNASAPGSEMGSRGGTGNGVSNPMAPPSATAVPDMAIVQPGSGPMPTAARADGHLAVTFTGETVQTVWLQPVGGDARVSPELHDGTFALGLAAGDYTLELTIGDTQKRASLPISVPGNFTRSLTIAVSSAGLTITETNDLEDLPSPAPSESPSPAN